jgi:hypothetical protein
MKKDQLLWVGLALILLVQGYLMWKINEKPETNLEVLKAAQKVSQGIDSVITQNNRLIERYDDRIARQVDTLNVINNYKTILNETYRSDISSLILNDSSKISSQYAIDYSKSDEMLQNGKYVNP